MGKCTNVFGIIVGLGALACGIASLIYSWIPQNPEIKILVEESNETNVLTFILPLVGTIICAVAICVLVIDMKADKFVLKWLAIIGFLAAAGVFAYAASKYTYNVVRIAIDLRDKEASVELASEITGQDQSTIQQWWDAIKDNLNISSFEDLRIQWGFAIAFAASLCNLICCLFYTCISCCGCN